MTYEKALERARTKPAVRQSDAEQMALFCDTSLMTLVGAVGPRLVWEGAQRKGITFRGLLAMVQRDPDAVHELMWWEEN